MRKVFKLPEVVFFQEGPGVRKWQFRGHGIKLLNGGNINNNIIDLSTTDKYISEEEAFNKYKHFLIKEGDLLIACSGIVVEKFDGKIAFVKNHHLPLCLNTSTMRFRSLESEKLYIKYFYYFLKSRQFKSQIQRLITGSAQLNFGPTHIKKVKISLPKVESQKVISKTLDLIDRNRQLLRAELAEYSALGESLFLEMFGDPVLNEKGWTITRLKTCLNFLTSGSRGWAKYYSTKGDIFLRIQNIGYDQFRSEDLQLVNAPDSTEANRTTVRAGDVILSITADLGRSTVIPDSLPKAHISQHLAILRLNENWNPKYVSAYIASLGGRKLFNSLNKGGVKAGLNFNDIRSYPLFKVPLSLQNEFAARIAVIEKLKAKTEAALAEADDLFNGKLQEVFG
ncbi:hypothetical protein CEQ90_04525 [Lewinellaceae bacterium SD302]|nr:hypothetical protein CEQ90_04525 [Lewinellaceae bacterium SD302]